MVGGWEKQVLCCRTSGSNGWRLGEASSLLQNFWVKWLEVGRSKFFVAELLGQMVGGWEKQVLCCRTSGSNGGRLGKASSLLQNFWVKWWEVGKSKFFVAELPGQMVGGWEKQVLCC